MVSTPLGFGGPGTSHGVCAERLSADCSPCGGARPEQRAESAARARSNSLRSVRPWSHLRNQLLGPLRAHIKSASEVTVHRQLVRETSRGVASGTSGVPPPLPQARQRMLPRPSARMSRSGRNLARTAGPRPPSRPVVQQHISSTPRPLGAHGRALGCQFRPDGPMSPNGATSITCAHWPRSSTRRCPPPRPGNPSRRAGSAAPSWVRCGQRSPGRPGGCPQTADRPR